MPSTVLSSIGGRTRGLGNTIAGALLLLSMLILGGCSDDEGTPTSSAEAPSDETQATYCRNVSDVRGSLGKVREGLPGALVQANPAGFQTTLQQASTDIDSLDSAARTIPGGPEGVAALRKDLDEYQALLATPDLVSVLPQLQQQSDEIAKDLTQLNAMGNCAPLG